MSIYEDFMFHVNTIVKWVKSCDDEAQIPICRDAVSNILVAKFQPLVDEKVLTTVDIEHAQNYFEHELKEQLRLVRYYKDHLAGENKLPELLK